MMSVLLLWRGGTWAFTGVRGYASDLASGCTENLEKGNGNLIMKKELKVAPGKSRSIQIINDMLQYIHYNSRIT
jgi:hypothetical protein